MPAISAAKLAVFAAKRLRKKYSSSMAGAGGYCLLHPNFRGA
jgi:hypothetical protein